MKKKPNLIKDALILFLITCISGLLLGVVYHVTKEPIARAEEEAKIKAYKQLIPDADRFVDYYKDTLPKADELLASSGYIENARIDGAYIAVDAENNILGYVVLSTSTKSYGGELSIVTGFNVAFSIVGVEILAINDTPGLGMNAKNESFRNQYVGNNSFGFTITKTGASKPGEIDALSSATITSNAFNNAVNAAQYYLLAAPLLAEGGFGDE